MEVSNEQYGQIVDWMDRQKRQIASLENENRELRRQLDELRRGIGVSLIIQGRALPIAILPSAEPVGPIAAAPASTRTGEYPASVVTSPHPQPYPIYPASPTYSAPLAPPVAAQPSYAPLAPDAVRATPAPDSTWLTSHARAVRTPAAAAPAGGMTERRRSVTPSQEMTPAWLREDAPMPMPNVPSSPPSRPSASQSASPKPRTLASATGKQQAVRSPLRQGPVAAPPLPGRPRRPTLPHLEPEHLPSLAQMTGRQPAVRLPGKPAAERTPFSDSFVLG